MPQRPLSVTIIGWFLIVSSLFGLVSTLAMADNPIFTQMIATSPLSASVHRAFSIGSAIITLVCGYGFLKGFNWSRFLYLGAGVLGLVFNLATVAIISVLAIGVVMLAVLAFFLFRPAANAWFGRGRSAGE